MAFDVSLISSTIKLVVKNDRCMRTSHNPIQILQQT